MYSFDIFDTLITRNTATPNGVFAIMQEKLICDTDYLDISKYIRLNFAELRINAEVLARKIFQKGNIEDISLKLIYETLNTNGVLTNRDIEKLLELERNIEEQCSVGITENIDKVKQLILSKEKVILISDMYLEEETIRRLLVKSDCIFENIKIYVSSVYKKTKGSGNLYWVVKNNEKVEFGDWTHFGDNVLGDYKTPSKLGIKVQLYLYPSLTPMEINNLEKNGKDPFVQLTIGTSRNARLLHHLDKEAAIGASLGGVILFPYVYWIIQESLRKGINKLYFIARDGYILKKIADIIICKYGYPISTEYIYGSRRAWRMASFSESNHDLNKLLSWSHPNHISTIDALADVFQITKEELYPYISNEYKKVSRLNSLLITSIQKELNNDEKFWKFLCQRHLEKRKNTIQYLKENIDFSDTNIAFVEVAGSGYTQVCLSNIISDFYEPRIQTFFFKMDSVQDNKKCRFYNFLPSNLYLHVIIEMLCRAPHGQTIEYAIRGGKMAPVIEETEGEALKRHGLLKYIRGIEKFTEEYINVIDKHNVYPGNLMLLLEYMNYITHSPDQMILDFIGGMPNSVTGREKKVIEYAPKLTYKDITNIFLKRTYEPVENYYRGTSLDYSVLRCTKRQQRYLKYCKKNHEGIVGSVFRIRKTLKEGKYEKNLKYKIPFEILKSKIVLYAAGNVGQSYYRQLRNSRKHKVVLWVDTKWEEFRKLGMPVSNPLEIKNIEYDQIVIAVAGDKVAEAIKDMLIGFGINKDKIIW